MAEFSRLDELCEWMRSNGATSARIGDIELTLGPAPQPVVAVSESSPPLTEADDDRRELEALLYSSGADITPFLRRRAG